MRRVAALLLLLLPAPVAAETAADAARDAVRLLESAERARRETETAEDEVSALAGAIVALEAGIDALTAALDPLAVQQAALSADLQARKAEIEAIARAIRHLATAEETAALLHPGGPAGGARAALLLAEVVPAIEGRAADVREDLETLSDLGNLQASSRARLIEGEAALDAARADLADAIAARPAPPRLFEPDPVREAILLSSAGTLDAFIADLDRIPDRALPPRPGEADPATQGLPLPVRGRPIGDAGQQATGETALPVATRPHALVVSPAAGALRYAGPLLDLGTVVILEPRSGLLFVFSGLARSYVRTGEIVAAGAPLGAMGDSGSAARDKKGAGLSTDGDETGAHRTETLYIEVRENNSLVDPTAWFRTQEDG